MPRKPSRLQMTGRNRGAVPSTMDLIRENMKRNLPPTTTYTIPVDKAAPGTKRVVAARKPEGPSLKDLSEAISLIQGDARAYGDHANSKPDVIHITESSGWAVRELKLVEETLTDGSTVLNVMMLF